jgi:hypothetical protein
VIEPIRKSRAFNILGKIIVSISFRRVFTKAIEVISRIVHSNGPQVGQSGGHSGGSKMISKVLSNQRILAVLFS